jgi:hypothetical protein
MHVLVLVAKGTKHCNNESAKIKLVTVVIWKLWSYYLKFLLSFVFNIIESK